MVKRAAGCFNKSMKRSRSLEAMLLAAACLVIDFTSTGAQPRAGLPRLDAESIQAQSRLEGLQRLLQPGGDPESLSLFLGQAFAAFPDALASLPSVQTHDDARWDEAIRELDNLVEDLGGGLVPTSLMNVSTLPPRLVAVRRYASQLVASWPASIREKYAQRMEKRIASVLERGLATRSEALLRRVADEAPGTGAARKALETLGDYAFSRGRLPEALSWWSSICPLPRRIQNDDPLPTEPLIQLKQVLAIAYLGDLGEARRQRDAFAILHPKATGSFGGVKGPYIKVMDALLERFTQSGDVQLRHDWLGLGGDASHHLFVPVAPSMHLWLDGPTWKVPLPPPPKTLKPEEVVFEQKRPLYHPLIVGKQVILTDRHSITVLDLITGNEQFRHLFPEASEAVLSAEHPAYTGCVERDLVVLRVGQPPDRQTYLKKPVERTWLVGVELSPGLDKSQRVRWKVGPPTDDPKEAFFNGPPQTYGGRVWIPFEEWRGGSVFQGVASLNPETGRWLTQTTIGKLPSLPPGRDTLHQPVLMSGAGNLLVVATQAGSIVALDNQNGKVVWALRYASQGPWTRLSTPSSRELAAPVVSLNRVYVAPDDSDLLLCLDVNTGNVVWEREILDVVQILGRSQDKLLFTTASGLRTVHAETGSDRDGWIAPAAGRASPHGRGLILGDWIFWPTRDPSHPVLVLSMEEGRPEKGHAPNWDRPRPLYFGPTMLRHLPAGNMAYGHGSLVIAGDRELVGFIRPKLLLEPRKKEAEKEKTPLATFRLGQSEADAGDLNAAFETLSPLLREDWNWQQLAKDRLHEMLVERIETHSALGRLEEAIPFLERAADKRFDAKQRAWALSRLGATDKRDWAWKRITGDAELLDEFERRSRLTPAKPVAIEARKEPPTQSQSFPLCQALTLSAAALPARMPGSSSLMDRFFVQHEDGICCHDSSTLKLKWRMALSSPVSCIGVEGSVALIAGPKEIRCVDLETGHHHWLHPNPARMHDHWLLENGLPVQERVPETFGQFRINGSKISFAWGIQRLEMAIGVPQVELAHLSLHQQTEATTPLPFIGKENEITALAADTSKTLWEVSLPISASEWEFLPWSSYVIVHPSGKQRVLPGGLDFHPALALAWQQRNPIARDDAEFFVLDAVRGTILQRIKLERGPGPYRARVLSRGLALSNGREISVFVSER